MVIRAQICEKNAHVIFFLAQVRMLSLKKMLRSKCSEGNKCSDWKKYLTGNAQFVKTAPLEIPIFLEMLYMLLIEFEKKHVRKFFHLKLYYKGEINAFRSRKLEYSS